MLPNGTRILPDGTVVLPDGTILPPGAKVLADGTILLADGTRVLPDGTKILADGSRILPDGTRVLADGTRVLPDGTRILADGTRILADGTKILPDGTKIMADGSVVLPDGTVLTGAEAAAWKKKRRKRQPGETDADYEKRMRNSGVWNEITGDLARDLAEFIAENHGEEASIDKLDDFWIANPQHNDTIKMYETKAQKSWGKVKKDVTGQTKIGEIVDILRKREDALKKFCAELNQGSEEGEIQHAENEEVTEAVDEVKELEARLLQVEAVEVEEARVAPYTASADTKDELSLERAKSGRAKSGAKSGQSSGSKSGRSKKKSAKDEIMKQLEEAKEELAEVKKKKKLGKIRLHGQAMKKYGAGGYGGAASKNKDRDGLRGMPRDYGQDGYAILGGTYVWPTAPVFEEVNTTHYSMWPAAPVFEEVNTTQYSMWATGILL